MSTFSTSIKAEMKRLDAQIDLFWQKERIFYQKFNMGNHLHIIDLGCGTGYLIHKLSLEFPLSKFTGVEQDPLLVQAALSRLQGNSSVVKIINSSIEHFDSQTENFDIAILRLVLEHVPDPFLVLNKIRSILKPEGRIIVIDNDFEYHLSTFPQIEELKDLYKAYRKSRIQDGGDPCIGRRLPYLLKQAGFNQVDLDIFTAHSQLIGDSPFLSSEGGGIPTRLAKSGFLQESVLHSLVRKWKEMLENPHHCLIRQLFAASGVMKDYQDSGNREEFSSKSFSDHTGASAAPPDYRQFLYDTISVSLNIDSALIDENTPLIDAGLDSVGALDIQNALKGAFNIEIPISAMLGGATPNQIAESLKLQLENRTSQNPDSPESSDIEERGTL